MTLSILRRPAPAAAGGVPPAPPAAPIAAHRPPPLPPAPGGPGASTSCFRLIYGSKGMGKTTLARALAWEYARRGRDVLWADVRGVGGGVGLGTEVDGPAAAVAAMLAARRAGLPFRVVARPAWGSGSPDAWGGLFRVASSLGRMLLVLDEAQAVASAQRIVLELAELLATARNVGVDLCTTVRTPPELHNLARGNRDVVYTFRQSSGDYAHDLAAEFFDGRRDVERWIAELPRLTYLRGELGAVSLGRVTV